MRWYLSLWPLLQSLQEGGDIIIIIDGELHVLTHNSDGNVLRETEMVQLLLQSQRVLGSKNISYHFAEKHFRFCFYELESIQQQQFKSSFYVMWHGYPRFVVIKAKM